MRDNLSARADMPRPDTLTDHESPNFNTSRTSVALSRKTLPVNLATDEKVSPLGNFSLVFHFFREFEGMIMRKFRFVCSNSTSSP